MFLFPLCGLKLECEKLVGEKTEIQRYYGMVSREVERMVENEKWEERMCLHYLCTIGVLSAHVVPRL